jgi:hypothetical protein
MKHEMYFSRNGDTGWVAKVGKKLYVTGTKDVVKAIELVYTKKETPVSSPVHLAIS